MIYRAINVGVDIGDARLCGGRWDCRSDLGTARQSHGSRSGKGKLNVGAVETTLRE